MLDYTHPIEYIPVVWDWRILRENFGAINNRDIGRPNYLWPQNFRAKYANPILLVGNEISLSIFEFE